MSRNQYLNIIGIALSILGILLTLYVPEVRIYLGIEKIVTKISDDSTHKSKIPKEIKKPQLYEEKKSPVSWKGLERVDEKYYDKNRASVTIDGNKIMVGGNNIVINGETLEINGNQISLTSQDINYYGSGNGIISIYTTCPNSGITTIWIDGIRLGTLDVYFEEEDIDCGVDGTISKILKVGKHTVKALNENKIEWNFDVIIQEGECYSQDLQCL